MPLTLEYVRGTAARYPELRRFSAWVEAALVPDLKAANVARICERARVKAMVLAAGRGERLRPLTDHTPKPLLVVRGKPLIVWHLEALARAGVREVVINLSWLGESIRQALGDGTQFGVHIQYSEEPPGALEVGGGIHRALPLLGDAPFIVVNGDTYTDLDLAKLAIAAGRTRASGPGAQSRAPSRRRFRAAGTTRCRPASLPRLTYSGIGVFRAELFTRCAARAFPAPAVLQRGDRCAPPER